MSSRTSLEHQSRSRSTRMRLRRLPILVLLLAGGCAVSTFKPQVDGFATATGQASEAYADMQATVLSAHSERLKQRALKGEMRVRQQPGDCLTTSERCRLEVVAVGGKSEALVPELRNITLLLHEIANYAASLQAVVNSDTPQQVTANLAAAGGSIQNLAAEIAKLPQGAQIGTDIGAFAAPTANLAAWIAGEYINLLQVEALRKATAGADPVIQQSRIVLEGASQAATDTTRATLADQLDNIREDYVKAPNDRSRLERLMSAAADYDKVLTATAPGIFADMAAAHHELTDHLAGKNITLADVSAAVDRFATKAAALHDIVASFRAAVVQVTPPKM